MGDIDYRTLLRKINGNNVRVIEEARWSVVASGIMDYHEGRIGEETEIKVGRRTIPQKALTDICEGCEGAGTPIIFVSGEYEATSAR